MTTEPCTQQWNELWVAIWLTVLEYWILGSSQHLQSTIGLRDVTNLCCSSVLGSAHSVTNLSSAIVPRARVLVFLVSSCSSCWVTKQIHRSQRQQCYGKQFLKQTHRFLQPTNFNKKPIKPISSCIFASNTVGWSIIFDRNGLCMLRIRWKFWTARTSLQTQSG